MHKLSYHRRYFFLFALAPFFSACNDIIEGDMTHIQVQLESPMDSLHTSSQSHQYRWLEVDGAFGYRFQVAKPNFDFPEEWMADTLVDEPNINWTLEPGEFTWRVRAENSASESAYSRRTIFIDSTETLNGQIVVLNSPLNNLVTSDIEIEFEWLELDGTDNYIIEVIDENTDDIELSTATVENSIELTLAEGEYSWRVYAVNSIPSVSDYQTRYLIIDLSAPTAPQLIAPANNISIIAGTPQDFEWEEGEDELSLTVDSIYFYQDIALNDELSKHKGVDGSFELLTSGLFPATYYWVVRTYDEAGNFSQSVTRNFSIN